MSVREVPPPGGKTADLPAHLPVAKLASRFSRELGRPSKDLYAVIGALILLQFHGTTDEATVEAFALNLAWQYALDIRAEPDASLCERTLRNYRRLLIERGVDQALFRSLVGRLINAIGVDTALQRLDSTAIRLAMRGLTRLRIIVEAIAKGLRRNNFYKLDLATLPRFAMRGYAGCQDHCTDSTEVPGTVSRVGRAEAPTVGGG